jgi:uracil-DNA glycosylase family 4
VTLGFFGLAEQSKTMPDSNNIGGYSLDLLHRCQCQICPLNHAPELQHPYMKPYGAVRPLVYILGEAPGETEDRRGIPFVGKAGQLLHWRIPDGWENDLRFNNVIRCRPPDNRDPSLIEIECCRPSVEEDIAKSKPEAIFGFGNWPLYWALDESGIIKWRGRRVPVEIGGHKCWYYPMLHPSFILHTRKRKYNGKEFVPHRLDQYGSDMEFAFALDLNRAFEEVRRGLPEPVVHSPEFAAKDIEIITDPQEAINAIRRMFGVKLVGLDYETGSLRPFVEQPKILTAALSSKEHTFAFPLEHRECTWSEQEVSEVLDVFGRFLYDAQVRKAVHNLPFEQEWSAFYLGPDCLRATRWECTMAQAYLLHGKRGDDYEMGGLSLDFLCLQHFGLHIKRLSNVNRKNLAAEPLDKILPYNGIDARYHRYLWSVQDKEIEAQGLREVYEHHLRRIPTMVLTQIQGLPVDQDQTLDLKSKYERSLLRIGDELASMPSVKQFRDRKGYDYRPSSPQDVKFMYRKILRANIDKTDEATITERMGNHPITKLTLKWRKTSKKLSTYVLPMVRGHENSALCDDDKLHPAILLTSTDTWRTSTNEPGVQNWPKHQEGVLEIRKQIAAQRGYKIVSFDYSGIQARNVAMESKDKRLIDAFWDDYDIHADWRDRIVKLYPRWIHGGVEALRDPKVAKKYRQKAKNEFVFASFFGAHPPTLSRHLSIPVEITERLRKMFMRDFSGIDDWQKGLFESFYETGYVTGLSGHRRYAPISNNQLINAPIQADEVLIVCDAMSRLSELEEDRFQAMLEVHDDLTFRWPVKDIDKNSEVVIEYMLNVPFEWARIVPIGVEMSIGDNWGEMVECEEKFSSKTWRGGLW